MISLNESNFHDRTQTGLVLIEFYSDYCTPCAIMSEHLDQLEKMIIDTKISFVRVNTDNEHTLEEQWNVINYPTIVLLKDGTEIGRHEGFESVKRTGQIITEWVNR